MFWYGHDPGGWGWFAMSLGMIIFWAVLIGAGVLLFRAFSRPGGGRGFPDGTPPPPPTRHTPTAEQLLAERFARGEIDEDEYRHRLDVLRGTGGPRLTKS